MRVIPWTVCLAVCAMPFCNAQAADDLRPATRPAAASQLEQLRADMDSFLAAARHGDRVTVMKYVGPASPRKQQAVADVHIAVLHGEEVLRDHFKVPATGLLAELAKTLASRISETPHLKPDGSAQSSMLHYVRSPDGIWQIDAADIHPREGARTYEEEMVAIERLNAAMTGWAESVDAGKYPAPAEAIQALEDLVKQATPRPK